MTGQKETLILLQKIHPAQKLVFHEVPPALLLKLVLFRQQEVGVAISLFCLLLDFFN